MGKPAHTATRLLRQSIQAPSFRIKAALSRWTAERGPVRLLVARRFATTSAPSLTEKTAWLGKVGDAWRLYPVAAVSLERLDALEAMVARVAMVAVVEVDEMVSFLIGGEADSLRRPSDSS